MAMKQQIVNKFFSKVKKSSNKNGCWIWIGPKNKGKYPMFIFNDGEKIKSILAHRFIYELKNGEIPIGMNICQKCGVALCVNHKHLYAAFSHRRPKLKELKEYVEKYKKRLNKEALVIEMLEKRLGNLSES